MIVLRQTASAEMMGVGALAVTHAQLGSTCATLTTDSSVQQRSWPAYGQHHAFICAAPCVVLQGSSTL
jgi:hypothetical protein